MTPLDQAEIFKYLASLGVGGIVAGFMFMYYRRDVKQYTELWKGQSDQLMAVVKDNTKAITENTVTIKALHKRDDRIEDALSKLGFFSGSHRRPREDNES